MEQTRVELNIDLGELPGEPEELYALATVANVACGGHAGDATSMLRAARYCRRHGTRLAAHPSYPDRDGFGRRALALPTIELRASLDVQLGSLAAIAEQCGIEVSALKPHGALYHQATADPELARLIVDAALSHWGPLTLVGEAGGAVEAAARARGLPFEREAFADRGYDPSGRMLHRTEPGALLNDPELAAEQALRFALSGAVDTLSVHGDSAHALVLARRVHGALRARNLLRARQPSEFTETEAP